MLFVVTISSDTETLLLNSLDLTLHRAGCIITCLTEVHKGRRKVIAMVTDDSYWNCATPLTLRPLNTKAAEKSQRVFAPLTPRLHALRQFRLHEFPVCGIVVFSVWTIDWQRKWSTWAVHICRGLFHCTPFSSRFGSNGGGTSKERKSLLNRKLSLPLLDARKRSKENYDWVPNSCW